MSKKLLAALTVALLASSSLVSAQSSQVVPISNLPPAALPLSGGEILPCTQAGVTKGCLSASIGAAQVANNAALQVLSTNIAPSVTRNGFNTPGDVPALLYTASSSACSLNSGNGDNGSQVRSANGTCWIASFPPGALDVREWGVVADGATDNTTALQAAWNYGGTVNTDILLPPSDTTHFLKFSTLTAPAGTFLPSNATGIGPLSAIVGRGIGQTVLESTVTGSGCAITFNAPSSTYSISANNRQLEGFQLRQINLANSGNGICLNQITGMSLRDFTAHGFSNGIAAQDAISVTIVNPQFIANTTGISANTTGKSRPNQWVIVNPKVSDQITDGFLFFNASDIVVVGGDFEGNNPSNTAGNATIQMQGNPIDGVKGLTILGGYYQNNGGDAEFEFVQNATAGSQPIAQNSIYGVEVGRVSSTTFTTNPVSIVAARSGQTTNVDVRGSSFWGSSSYTPSASRKYFAIISSGGAGKITGWGANTYGSPIEAPWSCAAAGVANCENEDDGHIEQWGSAPTGSSSPFQATVTWPLTCPTAADALMATVQNGSLSAQVSTNPPTTTTTTITTSSANVGVEWRLKCH